VIRDRDKLELLVDNELWTLTKYRIVVYEIVIKQVLYNRNAYPVWIGIFFLILIFGLAIFYFIIENLSIFE
jgi:hypothetical protein